VLAFASFLLYYYQNAIFGGVRMLHKSQLKFFINYRTPCEKIFATLHSLATATRLLPERPYVGKNLIRSRSIGLMIPNLNNVFFMDILRGIESVTAEAGFSIFICPTYLSPVKQARLIDDLLERNTGGIIVISNPALMAGDLKRALSLMQIVSIQSDIKGVDVISVTDEQGMIEATEYLLQSGHKKIAFIGYDSNLTTLNNRVSGYKAALHQYNVPVDENLIFKEHMSSSGYITAKNLLMSQNPPTAIQCINDHLAMGVYMAAEELGLKIPQDLSVSGFDNSVMSRLMTPNLTTVAQPAFEMGETAAQLIIKRIIGDERATPRSIILPTKHIIRDSTA